MVKRFKLWMVRYKMRDCAAAWQHAVTMRREMAAYEMYLSDEYARLSALELNLSLPDGRYGY
jgi:hypothetical protein